MPETSRQRRDPHAETGGADVSVVIPVFDDAPMLRRCLTALRDQRAHPCEIVVVDNNSADESAEVARAFGARVVPDPIQGIPHAAAAGYDAAIGAVIARLDADSLPGPDWVGRLDRCFREHPEIDLVTGDCRFYGGNALTRWIGEHWYIGGMYAVLTPLRGRAHLSTPRIHDDLDLSLAMDPSMRVLHDPSLVVEVSARPFASWSAIGRRLSWVLPTFRAHWRDRRDPDRRRHGGRFPQPRRPIGDASGKGPRQCSGAGDSTAR